MPILAREPNAYPADLLSQSDEICALGRQWRVLYTLARREKELVRRLRTLKIPCYCPQVKRRTKSPAGRTRESFVPLLPSYVFTCSTEDQRLQALTTNCVSRCLEVPDGRRLASELRQIERLIDLGAPLTPEARLLPGRKVRVRSGAMAGLSGTVVQRRGRDWLLVAIEFLQQGVSVLLEDCQVEAIDL